jgi:hypothetical protein
LQCERLYRICCGEESFNLVLLLGIVFRLWGRPTFQQSFALVFDWRWHAGYLFS